MRQATVFFTVLLVAMTARAGWAETTEADFTGEVVRRGDLVEHVDGSIRDTTSDFLEAIKPPASDADKWFVSVLTTRGCKPCKQLQREWETNRWLLALADPNDSDGSWAHFGVFDCSDESQAWRFRDLTIEAYPTILVQPPRTGQYGDPSTVIYQSKYGGDPKTLAQDIARSIRHYLEKETELHGISPPWRPTPAPDESDDEEDASPDRRPVRPFRIPPILDQPVEVPVEVTVPFPWQAILQLATGGFNLLAVAAIVAWVLYFIRQRRKAAGKTPLVDDETFKTIIEGLKRLSEPEEPKAAASKTTAKRRAARR